MNTFFSIMTTLLLWTSWAFAHEGEVEITNLVEADWVGPIIATAMIVSAILIARMMRKRPARQAGGSNE